MTRASTVVLITGASTGIGRATAERLAQEGYRVFGTSRDGAQVPGSGFTMVPLELASDASVRQCVRTVLEQAGQIDVLVNNAGFGVLGALEEVSDEQALAQMDVFCFGIHRMVRAVLPSMRARRSGRIINISSSASTMAIPFAGLYSAGKYAMAGLTEALRQEVAGLGVSVSYVEATLIRTEAAEDVVVADPIGAYAPVRDRAVGDFREGIRQGKDPEIMARALQRIIEARSTRLVYRVDTQAKLLPLVKAALPQVVWDAVFGAYRRVRGGTSS